MRFSQGFTVGALILGLGCGGLQEDFAPAEWQRLQSLSQLPDPPPDPSNKYVGNPAAQRLGQMFYFDSRFSGNATLLDMLRRPVQYARAAKGDPTQLSCASCHTPGRAGTDATSLPGNVSVGAGWYDVNGQQSVNAAYYSTLYWNGRSDSLWAQVVAVGESFVSMGGNRLKTAWVIADKYRATYESVFTAHPLPLPSLTSSELNDKLTGAECKRVPDPTDSSKQFCPPALCRSIVSEKGVSACVPRFPLQGRPGTLKGCQWGDATSGEPLNDAFDCMDAEDQKAITRVYVNFAKAIAAYEYQLISRNSAFDQYVQEGPDSTRLSPAAVRGARLFVGKASCVDCHNTPLFSDNDYHNIGVPQVGAGVPTEADCGAGGVCDCVAKRNCLPLGAWDGLSKLKSNGFRRDSSWSDDPTDASRKPFVDRELTDGLEGAWRTPSLPDMPLTAPYMHNGLWRSLEEVVQHYNAGGSQGSFLGRKSVRLAPLALSDEEVHDLVEFLKTLTGEPLPTALVNPPTLPL